MTGRQKLTAALHAHTCHPDGEACAWGGEDYPGEGTCAEVGEVGVEDAVMRWVATLAADLSSVTRTYLIHETDVTCPSFHATGLTARMVASLTEDGAS